MKISHLNKKKLLYTILAVLSICAFVGISILGYSIANKQFKKLSDDFYGFKIEWDDLDFSVLQAAIELEDFKLIVKGNIQGFKPGENMMTADKIVINARILPLLFKRTVSVEKIELDSPKVKVIRYRDGTNSLKPFLPLIKVHGSSASEIKKDEDSLSPSFEFALDKLTLDDSEIDFIDQQNGARLKLTDMDLTITDLNSKAGKKGIPSELEMDAQLDDTKGKIDLDGTINFFEVGYHFDLKQKAKNLPITYFRPYYQSEVPVEIKSGTMNVDSTMKSRKSYLTSTHNVSISGLKVEGKSGIKSVMGVPAQIFIAFLKSHDGAVKMTVQVDGDLEKGRFAVSKQFSRNLFAAIAEQVKIERGSEITDSLEKAGEDIKETFKKINPFKK